MNKRTKIPVSELQRYRVDTIPQKIIAQRILLIRGQRVMLDRDLAELYEVAAKAFIQAVKRNLSRCQDDFMFQLTKQEFDSLRSQFVTSNRGGRRYLPYVFTEQGVAMLSSVLRSERAIHVNIAIMRAFAKLREVLSAHKELSQKLDDLERKIQGHDKEIKTIFDAIRLLMAPPPKLSKKRIGF